MLGIYFRESPTYLRPNELGDVFRLFQTQGG